MRAALAEQYGQERLPRYTSYPTAPHFSPAVGEPAYRRWLGSIDSDKSLSLYLHIPFCRSMCWYCGCNTTVTLRDDPIALYAATLVNEVKLVAAAFRDRMHVSNLHFGGGTPTIMKPESFADIVGAIRRSFSVAPNADIAVEIDPRTLTEPMVRTLGSCGVSRASLGVQSFDAKVQRAINRVQSFEQTEIATRRLRQAGIRRINFDLIYGLPHQTVESCLSTVMRCLELRPDRFSVFGYAHVPSFKKHQRKIDGAVLPDSMDRHAQSEAIAVALQSAGYVRIGLDHFALPTDAIAVAQAEGRLRRNFQGYTDDDGDLLIGLGASAIGKLPQGFVQNSASTRDYLRSIADGGLATAKGYAFTADDRFRADIIERIMCDFSVDLHSLSGRHGRSADAAIADRERFARLVEDEVMIIQSGVLTVRHESRFLVRSVAAAFDAHLAQVPNAHSRAV